jgi:hypothetical protein
MNNIYDMKLHDAIEIARGITYVVRVPGGWLYTSHNTSVFVPYHNEFDDRKIDDECPF